MSRLFGELRNWLRPTDSGEDITLAVAEGLENAADLQAVQRMGCDIGQGFFLARPMPKASFIALLEQRALRKQAS